MKAQTQPKLSPTSSVLDDILRNKRKEIEALYETYSLSELLQNLKPSTKSLKASMKGVGPRFLFEYKRASPSEGLLLQKGDLSILGNAYGAFADGVSVLTDQAYFKGSFDDLKAVRKTIQKPILCKDFILDEVQILKARRAGADAILLILAAIDDAAYARLSKAARDLGMDVLTEVHTREEMNRAGVLGATLIGINNRDLSSLAISLDVTEKLAPLAPKGAVLISESGIQSRRDVVRLSPLVDGFLIGSALVRAPFPDLLVRHLVFGDVKVCGLTRPNDAKAAFEAGASFGGMIFVPGTPRAIELPQAIEIAKSAPMNWVGVFRDAQAEKIVEHAKKLTLSAVQLHGQESDDFRRDLRARLPAYCEIWQAVPIEECLRRDTFPYAERVIVDSQLDGRFGGTGLPFDWSLLDKLHRKDRLGLAGGITPANVAQTVFTGAGLIDVNSGVEEAPGKKSPEKLKALFSSIRKSALKHQRAGAEQ